MNLSIAEEVVFGQKSDVEPVSAVGRTKPFSYTLDCFGVPVALVTWERLANWFFEAGLSPPHAHTCARTMYFANAHTANIAYEDPSFCEVLRRADIVLNDGIGIELYAKLAGVEFTDNFNGTDLLPRIYREAEARGEKVRVFLYGSQPGYAEKAAAKIEASYPHVKVVGTVNGYVRDGVVERINDSHADILLVGMGNPLQEKWIDENKDQLRVGIAVGVGALLDFLSGEVTRAPQWMRTMCIEWLYRFAREPRRLARRYCRGNPLFLARAFTYVGRRRKFLFNRA
jgi:exopolysaccharide biosynthesis WecB/TagA/CpsF family protein